MPRRRSTSIVPAHTGWGVVFVAACLGLAAGLAVGFFIGWNV